MFEKCFKDGVRETLCSKCLHCRVCSHKDNYLSMIKRLEELFYSVPEEERAAMVFRDPDCPFKNCRSEFEKLVGEMEVAK